MKSGTDQIATWLYVGDKHKIGKIALYQLGTEL